MKLKLSFALLMFTGCVLATENHWGYDGNVSPEHWGEISKDFVTCKVGKNQSPINVTSAKVLHSHDLSYHYQLTEDEIVNNGHTIQINVNTDNDYLTYKGKKYYLKQFHFHAPSENQIHGKSFAFEVHFVHADKEGHLLVLAVMANEGKENKELAKAWSIISNKENVAEKIKEKQAFNVDDFLPKNKHYYHFTGSLTTPPCTEGVEWIILKEPVEISKAQLEKFTNLLKAHHNNRPIQPINNRQVDED